MKTIVLRKGKSASLKRFHPWVFSGAIAKKDSGIQEGETVRVVNESEEFLAVGHFENGSIAVRVLSFDDRKIDAEFWEERIREAFKLRVALGLVNQNCNNMFRLVHGEGDQLPGLIIDVYGDTAVVQAHSVGMHLNRDVIGESLLKCTDGVVRNVYYKSETTLHFKSTEDGGNQFLIGQTDDNIALEYGLKFHIDWLRGQKTGFFVDQRENRKLLEKYAKGRRVLNMFCYTGGFSVYAMRGGAQLVHSVDSSAKAIDLTNANIGLNFPDDKRHEAFTEDAFRFLSHIGHEQNYDLIVLDPPSFCQAQRRHPQRHQGIHPPQHHRLAENRKGRYSLHVQLLTGCRQGAIPSRRVHGRRNQWATRENLASAPPTCRPPDKHIPPRRGIPQRAGALR